MPIQPSHAAHDARSFVDHERDALNRQISTTWARQIGSLFRTAARIDRFNRRAAELGLQQIQPDPPLAVVNAAWFEFLRSEA